MKYFIFLLIFFLAGFKAQAQECTDNLRAVYSMSLEELNNKNMCLEIPKNPANTREINEAILSQRKCLTKNSRNSHQSISDYINVLHDHTDTKKLSKLEAKIDRPEDVVGSNRRGKDFITSVSDACIKSFKRDLKINIIYEPNSKKIRELFAQSTPLTYADDKNILPYLLLTESPERSTRHMTQLKTHHCIPGSIAKHYNIKAVDDSEHRALLKISSYEKIMRQGTPKERVLALEDLQTELQNNSSLNNFFNCRPSEASNALCRIYDKTNGFSLSGSELILRDIITGKKGPATQGDKQKLQRLGPAAFAFKAPHNGEEVSHIFLSLLSDLKTYAIDHYKRKLISESASIRPKNANEVFGSLTDDDLVAHAASNERLYQHMRQVRTLICRNIRNTKIEGPLVVNIIAQEDGGRFKRLLQKNFNNDRVRKHHSRLIPEITITEHSSGPETAPLKTEETRSTYSPARSVQ